MTCACFPSLEVCIVPSGTVKLVWREEAFGLVLAQWSLSPVSEANSVFSNMDLRRATKDSSNRLYALGVSWTVLVHNSEEGFLSLAFGFLLGGSLALGG